MEVAMRFRLTAAAFAVILTVAAIQGQPKGQRRDVFIASRNHPAITYSTGPTTDAVAALNERLKNGTATLAFDSANGYLGAVLKALDVPVESQTLVFSQTSFQGPLINIHNPRAIYFTDSVAVGWVRGGTLLEVVAQDARQGPVFYALDQKQGAAPEFKRDEQCLACHLSWETLGVPGLTVHSVYPLPDEKSYVNGFTTIHGSPLEQRWGGWWVTGVHGGAKHMGNIPVMPADKGRGIPNPTRALPSVAGLFDPRGYPSLHSDVVALLVLEHQTHMTNLITRIGWEARVAAAEPSADAAARVREAAVDVVDYLLFIDEAPLAGPIKGSSAFTQVFAARGPKDGQGRSLRDLDLQRRLFRYPCSYMIYTDAFEALLPAAKDAIYTRMWDVLSRRAREPRYRRLGLPDRRAIVEILRATKRDLPASFNAAIQ
jgi:hypothetical protein